MAVVLEKNYFAAVWSQKQKAPHGSLGRSHEGLVAEVFPLISGNFSDQQFRVGEE